MGKKDTSKRAPAQAIVPKLSHNPFGDLAGRLVLPSTPAEEATRAVETEPERPRSAGRLVQRRETKRRNGKAVIVISGFGALKQLDRDDVEQLAKELKAKLGCGGTVEGVGTDLEIVIQGDQAQKVAELLRTRGFRVDGVVS